MRNINNRSDFFLLQKLYVKDGETGDMRDMGVPECDFSLAYYTTSKDKRYVVSGKKVNCKTVYTNCRNEDGKLIVLFDGYCLAPGELKVDIRLDIPDEMFPDGIRTEVIPSPTHVRLTSGPSDCYGMAEAVAILPFIKGKDMLFEDLTPEQYEDLIRQVAEAVKEDLDQTVTEVLETQFEDISEDEFASLFQPTLKP